MYEYLYVCMCTSLLGWGQVPPLSHLFLLHCCSLYRAGINSCSIWSIFLNWLLKVGHHKPIIGMLCFLYNYHHYSYYYYYFYCYYYYYYYTEYMMMISGYWNIFGIVNKTGIYKTEEVKISEKEAEKWSIDMRDKEFYYNLENHHWNIQ